MTRIQQWLSDRLEEIAHSLRSEPVNRDQIKAAILKRRDQHRRLNNDWQHVDREVISRSS